MKKTFLICIILDDLFNLSFYVNNMLVAIVCEMFRLTKMKMIFKMKCTLFQAEQRLIVWYNAIKLNIYNDF